jgi:hypothetical protein
MAQVRLLKISSDGFPEENSQTDDVTFASFTVQGGGPVLGATGLDMNNQDIIDVQDLAFVDPATATINQTAGSLIVDNLMAKERSNVLTTSADILFPVITNTAGQVDAFRLPAIAGAPTATPTTPGEGFLVWDSTGDRLFTWNGTGWTDQSSAVTAQSIDNLYLAEVAVAARDVVYISSANNVSPADADVALQAERVIGFATNSAAAAASVTVRDKGIVSGFTGLTAGDVYFLSAATPGAITNTAPSGAGARVVQVGVARSATQIHVRYQYVGRRAA